MRYTDNNARDICGITLQDQRKAIQKAHLFELIEDIQKGALPAISIVTEPFTPPLDLFTGATDIVIVGVGGSSLGAQTLVKSGKTPVSHIHFVDNVDPDRFDALVNSLPLETTKVLSVSKSGGTLETLAETALFMQKFQNKGLPIKNHIIGLSEPTDNTLRRTLNAHGCTILEHPTGIGGRFTLFSNVGLIPAALAGHDAAAIRSGAAHVLKTFIKSPETHPATLGSTLTACGNLPMHVMMPYGDRLRTFALWFVQLWAESLGKDGKGSTPIAAVGSTDQHSCLQLMMDGPVDKLITIISADDSRGGTPITSTMATAFETDVLSGLTLGNLLYHQAHGTAEALIAAGKPVRHITVPDFSEKHIGALAMHMMLETVITARMIGVDAFDQPGVEDAKKRTIAALTA